VPITVSPGFLCTIFNSIELQIVATCEIPNSDSQVFQYGIVNAAISYDDAKDRIYASNSTQVFDVSWPSATSRRLDSKVLDEDTHSDRHVILEELKEMMSEFNSLSSYLIFWVYSYRLFWDFYWRSNSTGSKST